MFMLIRIFFVGRLQELKEQLIKIDANYRMLLTIIVFVFIYRNKYY